MPKDTLQKHDQGPLSQTMWELEATNTEVSGILFFSVGKGKERAFLFPTYVVRQEGEVTVNEFLVVNQARAKAIQISSVDMDKIPQYMKEHNPWRPEMFFADPSRVSQGIVEASDTGGYQDKGWNEGERLKFKFGDFELKIGSATTEWKRRLKDSLFGKGNAAAEEWDGSYQNCRLVNPNEAQVKAILVANMERVKGNRLQTISQKISQALSTVS